MLVIQQVGSFYAHVGETVYPFRPKIIRSIIIIAHISGESQRTGHSICLTVATETGKCEGDWLHLRNSVNNCSCMRIAGTFHRLKDKFFS
ncbi:MAG: hypothetical protein C4520_11580 [Candidatus Abyssobacteria bacterium SURF_5]|uniref:Uncharacterized protein n=1 Tax=Abyssobacteria bacterium (strain SURF_5) TaxID=2093360 RepID=A0A3A4NQG3_ABYX5|nr:MAG: hypothetical protein C4520_11580 [Candidatus Abyssubacteria bacterium SURF_5]